MEKIKSYPISIPKDRKEKYPTIGIPINWLRQYAEDGDELELYQEGDKLILTPKKKEKAEAPCK